MIKKRLNGNFSCMRFQSKIICKSILKMIEVDGNDIGGGGQILRISIGLSSVFIKSVHLKNILKGRAKEGLQAQHLIGLGLMQRIAKAKVEGDILNSTDVVFRPHRCRGGKYLGDTQTAGSVCLMFQACLPCIIFGKDTVFLTLKGGTNVPMAPQIDYTLNVFKPNLEKFGATFDCKIIRRGFYPAGRGRVEIEVKPVDELQPINLTEFGEIKYIKGEAYVSGTIPLTVAVVMARTAENILKKSINAEISIKSSHFDKSEAFRNGSGINITAVTTTGCYLSGSALGENGVHAGVAGKKAAEEILDCLKREDCVDQHTQDQLIIFMALANGKSRVKTGPITEHTASAIKVTEMFTKARFNIVKLDDSRNIIECDGKGKAGK